MYNYNTVLFRDPKKHHEEKKPIESEKTSDPSKEEEKSQTFELDLTGRNPIPSERACVEENIKKYKEKG